MGDNNLFNDLKRVIGDGVIDTPDIESLVSHLSGLHITDPKGVYNAHFPLCRRLHKSKSYEEFVVAQAKTILPHESDVDAAHIHVSTGIFIGIMLGLLAAERLKAETVVTK